jgi:hypothetical protein
MARIPMRGRVESLNASVAGSILLFEAAAQRGLPEAEHPPAGEDDVADATADALADADPDTADEAPSPDVADEAPAPAPVSSAPSEPEEEAVVADATDEALLPEGPPPSS